MEPGQTVEQIRLPPFAGHRQRVDLPQSSRHAGHLGVDHPPRLVVPELPGFGTQRGETLTHEVGGPKSEIVEPGRDFGLPRGLALAWAAVSTGAVPCSILPWPARPSSRDSLSTRRPTRAAPGNERRRTGNPASINPSPCLHGNFGWDTSRKTRDRRVDLRLIRVRAAALAFAPDQAVARAQIQPFPRRRQPFTGLGRGRVRSRTRPSHWSKPPPCTHLANAKALEFARAYPVGAPDPGACVLGIPRCASRRARTACLSSRRPPFDGLDQGIGRIIAYREDSSVTDLVLVDQTKRRHARHVRGSCQTRRCRE